MATRERDRARIGAAITACVLLWLLVQQLSVIAAIGNGLSPTADPYDEADAIRAAQHYVEKGFFVDAGLPHIVYGPRFPSDGWVIDLDQPLASGVYTRYPPLPELLCGLYEKVFGFEHLWAWRLVPLLVGLGAILFAFLALRSVLDPVVAGAMTLLLSSVPMITSHMHGLSFHGYAQALLLTQLAVLTRLLFSDQPPAAAAVGGIAGLTFVQGWLSFDHAFVVILAVLPLALLARDAGHEVKVRSVVLLLGVSGAGFATASIMHFAQVAWFYGSPSLALKDFVDRAVYRSLGEQGGSHITNVVRTSMVYTRLLWFAPNAINPLLKNTSAFGPLLPLLSLVVLVPRLADGLVSSKSTPAGGLRSLVKSRGAAVLAMLLSYGIAWLWILVMPQHAGIHLHFVPHVFFLSYFIVVLDLMLRAFGRAPIASLVPRT